MASGSPIVRKALFCLAYLGLYFALSRPEVIFLTGLGFTAWYPATGLTLTLLLGLSPWYIPLAFFADRTSTILIYHQPVGSMLQWLASAGVALSYCGAAYLLRGPFAIDPVLRRRRDVFRYLIVTMGAAILATLSGVSCLVADGTITKAQFWSSAVPWFFGDGIALLGIAPFLLIHLMPLVRKWLDPASAEEPEASRKKTLLSNAGTIAEGLAQMGALLATLWIIFGPVFGAKQLFYLSYVPIIWMAMRQGIRRVVTGLLLFNFGVVAALHIFSVYPGTMAKIGLLMLVVSAVGLIVGSAVTERHRMALELQEQTIYLNSLIQNNPLGIAVLNPEGRVELTNQAFESLFLYRQPELYGVDLDTLLCPGGDPLKSSEVTRQVFAGNTLQASVRRRRKDGQWLDVEMHAVPLVVNGQVQGAFTIYRDISEQIKASQAEHKHAESLGHLVQELESRANQMSLLSQMGDMLECCGTVKEASAVVAQFAQKLFPDALSGRLYLFKASRNLAETSAAWGVDNSSEACYPLEACWALRRGKSHWSTGENSGVNCFHLPSSSSVNTLCVPMVGQEETLGVLQLQFAASAKPKGDFSPESVQEARQQLANTVAGQIAFSLTSLRLRETLRDQSIRDPLTGLFNRRFMEESLNRELQRAARKRHSVSILFIDLDHFKHFNDTFGHEAGDAVLHSVAELFLRFFRSDDVCCRYGGEEFAIILPESTSEYATIRANALREEVKRMPMHNKDRVLGPITLSIGVAAFPEDASSTEDLLRVADRCLYQSKASGRDAVTVATHERV